jgi:hypothetical protein
VAPDGSKSRMSGVFLEIRGKHTAKPNSRKTVVLVDVNQYRKHFWCRLCLSYLV